MPPKEKKTEGVKAKGKAADKKASKVTKAVAKATKSKSAILRSKSPLATLLKVSQSVCTRSLDHILLQIHRSYTVGTDREYFCSLAQLERP